MLAPAGLSCFLTPGFNLLAAFSNSNISIHRQISELLLQATRPGDGEPVHFRRCTQAELHVSRKLRLEGVLRIEFSNQLLRTGLRHKPSAQAEPVALNATQRSLPPMRF